MTARPSDHVPDSEMAPALLAGAATVSLGLSRALGEHGVPVVVAGYDRKDFAQHSRWVRASHRLPHPEHDTAGYVAALMALAEHYPRAVLFPTTDETLAATSRHHATLAQAFRVACAPWDTTQQLIVKWRTHEIASAAGVPSPETALPRSEAEVRDYASRVRFPCLVKPTQGHLFFERFGRKMVRVEDPTSLLAAYREAVAAGLEVMIQELIPGDDTTVANYNAYAAEGRVLVEFTADHVRAGPPWLGSPRVALSRVIPELLGPGRTLLQAIRFSGYACTEFKRDPRDGVWKLMEVNGRHNLSSLLAVRCGLNFPWLHYRHLVFGEPPAAATYREGVYWTDLVRDVGYSAKYFLREGQRPADYVRPYLRPHVDAILDWRDPRPFLRRCGNVLLAARVLLRR